MADDGLAPVVLGIIRCRAVRLPLVVPPTALVAQLLRSITCQSDLSHSACSRVTSALPSLSAVPWTWLLGASISARLAQCALASAPALWLTGQARRLATGTFAEPVKTS